MISFGIDIGSTTVRASCVEIKDQSHKIREPELVFLTPFRGGSLEEDKIFASISQWAGKFSPPDIGSILFTGETLRAANLRALSDRLLEKWPEFLCAQVDSETESILSAKGSGALELSERWPGRTILQIDIGGGTSNFAWIVNGKIVDTACLDLGCRKWILDPKTHEIVARREPAEEIEALSRTTCRGVARKREDGSNLVEALADKIAELIIQYAQSGESNWVVHPRKQNHPRDFILVLSGGIVDAWHAEPFSFGDIGYFLARALEAKCKQDGIEFHLSKHSGRATVLGVSSHAYQFSGVSAWDSRKSRTGLKNIPVATNLPDNGPVAILLHPKSANLPDIQALVDLWAGKVSGYSGLVVFLLQKNLARTFGHLLNNSLRDHEFLVLDELSLDSSSVFQTLDLGPWSDDGRLPVILRKASPEFLVKRATAI